MKKQIIYLFLILLLVCVSVSHAKVEVQLPQDTGFLNIQYTEFETFPYNHNITFTFHVYNSTAHLLDNSTTICDGHLYNKYGEEILGDTCLFDGEAFYYIADKSYFNYKGKYSYIIHCNSSANNEAGYASNSFDISDAKYINTNDSPASIAVALFLLSITIGLLILPMIKKEYVSFESVNTHYLINMLIRRAVWVLGLLMLWLDSVLIMNLAEYGGVSLIREFTTISFISGIVCYGMICIIFLGTLFSIFQLNKKIKNNKRFGNDE